VTDLTNRSAARERVLAAIAQIDTLQELFNASPIGSMERNDAAQLAYRMKLSFYTHIDAIRAALLTPAPPLTREEAEKAGRYIALAHCAPDYLEDCARDIVSALEDAYRRGQAAGEAESPAQRVAFLRKLKPGWDSYGASAISEAAIKTAEALLHPCQVVPCGDGGVQLEWADYTVSIGPDGRLLEDAQDEALSAKDAEIASVKAGLARLHSALEKLKIQAAEKFQQIILNVEGVRALIADVAQSEPPAAPRREGE
jgi:hypothetical protein